MISSFTNKRHLSAGVFIISLFLVPFFWTLFLNPVDVILMSGEDNAFLISLVGLTNSLSSSKDIVRYA